MEVLESSRAEKDSRAEFLRAKRLRSIKRLCQAADALASGGFRQVTVLDVVSPLIDGERPDLGFYTRLLRTAHGRLSRGESLARSHAMPLEAKSVMFQGLLNAASRLPAPGDAAWKGSGARPTPGVVSECIDQIRRVIAPIRSSFPGFKRVWVHATRRRIPDPDLLLLDAFGDFVCELLERKVTWYGPGFRYIAYALSASYVSGYDRLRYVLDARSAPRFMDIADYWSDFHFGKPAGELLRDHAAPEAGFQSDRIPEP